MKRPRLTTFALAAFAALLPASASACATCFGKSDSAMAKGMNAGIFSLLLIITSMLVLIAVFFAYILRRAARLGATPLPPAAAPAARSQSQPQPQPLSQPTT